MPSFDDTADKYFPSISNCSHFYFFLSIILVTNQPFIFVNRLGFLIPEHYCQQPVTSSTWNWSVSDIVNLSIPYKENPQDPPQIGQPFSPCTEYDIDRVWPLITKNTTLDEALNIRSALYPNLTVRECSRGVQFTPSPYLRLSAAQDFKSVCHNRYQISVSNSFYLIGMLIGCLMAGPLSDNFGRRPVILWSCAIGYVFGLLTSASVNIWMYSVMRLFLGTNMNIACIVAIVLMSEWVEKHDRNNASLLRRTHQALLGAPALILLFYLIQNWRWTHAAYCYPIIFLLTGFYAWPESPRWLLSQGRVDECFELIKTISSRNSKWHSENGLSDIKAELVALAKSMKQEIGVSPNDEVIQMIEKDKTPDLGSTNNNSNVVLKYLSLEWKRLSVVFRIPVLRRNFIVVVILYFLQEFLFFGVKFYSIRLQGNPFVIALLTGLIGIPGNFLQWIAYRLFDRKWPMVVLSCLCTLSFGIACVLMWLGHQGAPIIGVTTAAMLFIEGLFPMTTIRIPEMFPATIRTTALGASGSIALLGSILAMYVEQLDQLVWAPLPLLIFTICAAIAFIVSFFMPPGKGEMLDVIKEND